MFGATSNNDALGPSPPGAPTYFVDFDFAPEPAPEPEPSEPELAGALKFLRHTLDEHVHRALEAGSKDAFLKFWEKHWEEFSQQMFAFQTIRRTLREQRGDDLASGSDYAEKLASIVESAFGADAAEDVFFAACTFTRTAGLATRIAKTPPLRSQKQRTYDNVLADKVRMSIAWHVMGVRCLVLIAQGKQVPQDVTDVIFDIIRFGSVQAFRYASDAMRLRRHGEELPKLDIEWDEEDQRLVDSHFGETSRLLSDFEDDA